MRTVSKEDDDDIERMVGGQKRAWKEEIRREDGRVQERTERRGMRERWEKRKEEGEERRADREEREKRRKRFR